MPIERVNKFDYMKIAYGQSLDIIKSKINEIAENEPVLAINEKVLVIKIGGVLYRTQLEEVR